MTEPTGIAKSIGQFSVFLGKACGMFYLTAIFLSVYEVFMRYALDAPTSWTSETIMMLVASAWFLCVGAITQQRRHITVTTMELLIGPTLWRRLVKLAVALSMLAVAGLIFAGWKPMMATLTKAATGAMVTSGSAFDPPTPTYLKVMLVVAAFLYLLQLFANLITPSHDLAESEGTGVE